jgi:hypothetical protein
LTFSVNSPDARLVLDPERVPAVAAIFAWRTEDKLGGYATVQRLAVGAGRYPGRSATRWDGLSGGSAGRGSAGRGPGYGHGG